MLGRRYARARRTMLLRLQRWWRDRQSRRAVVLFMGMLRKTRAATRIQRLCRGRQGPRAIWKEQWRRSDA